MENTAKTINVGISIGDINGIGPEITLKTVQDYKLFNNYCVTIYASTKVLSYWKKNIKKFDLNFNTVEDASQAKKKKINVVNISSDEIKITPGQSTEESGRFAMLSLEAATKDLANGKLDVLVTAPIDKNAIQKAGFKFPGHTEYLADMSGGVSPLMLMTSEDLKVALVTIHEPLENIKPLITQENIQNHITLLQHTLIRDFAISKPKIAVLGLNPHAGEKGKIGTEEQEIISPAIQKMKKEGYLVYGPYPADGFFGSQEYRKFDAVLAMYHDQGLIPFKTIAQDYGVNYTAGLPIVRTSPDHGTALDISGKNIASPTSMRNALWTAIEIYKTRQQEKELRNNKLQKQREPK